MPLKFTCYIRQENDVSWVLSAASRKHLADEHPVRLQVVQPGERVETYLAA